MDALAQTALLVSLTGFSLAIVTLSRNVRNKLFILYAIGASIIAAWALMRELLFGIRTERLVKDLAAEHALPEDDLPRRPSGRPDREAADTEFDRYRAEVDAAPESWRAWFRLGLAYDASGDRRRARAALRRAIALNREST